MRIITAFLLPLLFMLAGVVSAGNGALLPSDDAFLITARTMPDNTFAVDFRIAPGYALYQDRLTFLSDNLQVKLSIKVFPAPIIKYEPVLEKKVAYYRDRVTVLLTPENAATPFRLSVHAQGCATKQGVCYPPLIKTFLIPALK